MVDPIFGHQGFVGSLLSSAVLLEQSKILPDTSVEQGPILGNHADMASQTGRIYLIDWSFTIQNLPTGRHIEPHQQLRQGGFAGTRSAHNGNFLSLRTEICHLEQPDSVSFH